MKDVMVRVGWGAAVVGLLLSPIALIYAVPAAIGFGLDIADLPSLRLVSLAVWGPVGLALLRRALRRVPLEQVAARFWLLRLGHAQH